MSKLFYTGLATLALGAGCAVEGALDSYQNLTSSEASVDSYQLSKGSLISLIGSGLGVASSIMLLTYRSRTLKEPMPFTEVVIERYIIDI